MELIEKTVSTETVYKGIIVNIRRDKAELVDGRVSNREVVEHPGGVCVFALDNEGKVIMVRQYRYPMGEVVLELPAGKADPGEEPMVTATRELAEETGYHAADVRHLISFYPTCGYSNEHLHIYICKNLTKGEKHLDRDECIDLEWIDADRIIELIAEGKIQDGKTIIGILFARQAGEI